MNPDCRQALFELCDILKENEKILRKRIMQKSLDFHLSWKKNQTVDKNGPATLDGKSRSY